MTYPSSFRKKVLTIKEKEKLSFIEIAGRFSLSKTTIFKWSKRLDPQKHRNKQPIKIDREALKKDIQDHPDSYGYERASRLGVSASGIKHAKKRIGVTYKKNSESPQSCSRKKIYVLPTN